MGQEAGEGWRGMKRVHDWHLIIWGTWREVPQIIRLYNAKRETQYGELVMRDGSRFPKHGATFSYTANREEALRRVHESLQGRMSVTKGVLKMLADASDKIEEELGDGE